MKTFNTSVIQTKPNKFNKIAISLIVILFLITLFSVILWDYEKGNNKIALFSMIGIIIILIIRIFLTIAIKNFIVKGEVKLGNDSVQIINIDGSEYNFKLDELKHLGFTYYSYDGETYPRYSFNLLVFLNLQGNKNTIEFEHDGKKYNFEFYLKNSFTRSGFYEYLRQLRSNGKDFDFINKWGDNQAYFKN